MLNETVAAKIQYCINYCINAINGGEYQDEDMHFEGRYQRLMFRGHILIHVQPAHECNGSTFQRICKSYVLYKKYIITPNYVIIKYSHTQEYATLLSSVIQDANTDDGLFNLSLIYSNDVLEDIKVLSKLTTYKDYIFTVEVDRIKKLLY